jgi:phospholipid/cholesterol/gamma-HCH transport system ATP-binding protein
MADSEPRSHYLAFSRVYKSFDRPALVDCNFSLDVGKALAIAGADGSGKSLILQLLMGFEKPDQGEVVTAHETVESADDWERIRRKVALVSQGTMLLESLTVAQNAAFFLQTRDDYDESNRSDVTQGFLQMGNIESFQNSIPVDMPIAQRRMLALLQALGNQPECILLDEPTALLDPLLSQGLRELILRLKRQLRLTMVIATEDLDLIGQIADDVLLLDRGEIVFAGSLPEFLASSDVRVQRYLRMETE